MYSRRKGKSSAAVHSSNLVVLESAGEGGGGDAGKDGELEMGNKSSSGGFSPAPDGKKRSGMHWHVLCTWHTFSSYQVTPGHVLLVA